MRKKLLQPTFLALVAFSLVLTGCEDEEKEKALAEAEQALRVNQTLGRVMSCEACDAVEAEFRRELAELREQRAALAGAVKRWEARSNMLGEPAWSVLPGDSFPEYGAGYHVIDIGTSSVVPHPAIPCP